VYPGRARARTDQPYRHLAACHRSGEVEGAALPSADALGAMNGSRQSVGRTGSDRRNVVLPVKGLVKHFPLPTGAVFRRQVGTVRAVDGVSFDLREGETLGLVGQSGCGKLRRSCRSWL
jgi:glutathione transport system ATP-binding protein